MIATVINGHNIIFKIKMFLNTSTGSKFFDCLGQGGNCDNFHCIYGYCSGEYQWKSTLRFTKWQRNDGYSVCLSVIYRYEGTEIIFSYALLHYNLLHLLLDLHVACLVFCYFYWLITFFISSLRLRCRSRLSVPNPEQRSSTEMCSMPAGW